MLVTTGTVAITIRYLPEGDCSTTPYVDWIVAMFRTTNFERSDLLRIVAMGGRKRSMAERSFAKEVQAIHAALRGADVQTKMGGQYNAEVVQNGIATWLNLNLGGPM